jgi:hypothetical protein
MNDGSSSEDAASIAEHLKGVTSEMAKEKPRDSVVLPLMRTLFSSRRAYIKHDAEDVGSILEIYPALRRPSVVSDFHTSLWDFEVGIVLCCFKPCSKLLPPIRPSIFNIRVHQNHVSWRKSIQLLCTPGCHPNTSSCSSTSNRVPIENA